MVKDKRAIIREAIGRYKDPGPEAPSPVDLHLKTAEGAAQGLTPVLSVDLGFPFREKGSGGGHPLFSQTCYPPR